MPKLDLRNAIRIKGAGGEINALKGHGFSWIKPSGDVDPILAYFQSTGADGAYYTPWDKSTLFQDAAGTIPVVNDGDPVGLMLDISGNGHHAVQSVSSRRSVYDESTGVGRIIPDRVDDTYNIPLRFIHPSSVIFCGQKTATNDCDLVATSGISDNNGSILFQIDGNSRVKGHFWREGLNVVTDDPIVSDSSIFVAAQKQDFNALYVKTQDNPWKANLRGTTPILSNRDYVLFGRGGSQGLSNYPTYGVLIVHELISDQQYDLFRAHLLSKAQGL